MDDRWHQLLDYWITQEYKHSLTFPFLIGALRTPVGTLITDEKVAIKELGILINQISDYFNENYIFHIYRCPDLDKHVLSKIGGKTPPPTATSVLSSDGKTTNLYVSDISTGSNVIDHHTLVSTLWVDGGEAILNGNFSCRGTLFQPFNKHELAVIAKALG